MHDWFQNELCKDFTFNIYEATCFRAALCELCVRKTRQGHELGEFYLSDITLLTLAADKTDCLFNDLMVVILLNIRQYVKSDSATQHYVSQISAQIFYIKA